MNISNIENKLINHEKINDNEIKILLDYIVTSVRENVNDETFEYKCDLAQGLISDYLNKLGVEDHPCSTNHCVHMNSIGHSFVVAVFGIISTLSILLLFSFIIMIKNIKIYGLRV